VLKSNSPIVVGFSTIGPHAQRLFENADSFFPLVLLLKDNPQVIEGFYVGRHETENVAQVLIGQIEPARALGDQSEKMPGVNVLGVRFQDLPEEPLRLVELTRREEMDGLFKSRCNCHAAISCSRRL
jgi:hypothetical protein